MKIFYYDTEKTTIPLISVKQLYPLTHLLNILIKSVSKLMKQDQQVTEKQNHALKFDLPKYYKYFLILYNNDQTTALFKSATYRHAK